MIAHRRHALFALAILLLAMPVATQGTASTLVRLTERADLIAEVDVLATRVERGVRTVTFKVRRILKGSLAGTPTFTLEETDTPACGNALRGLVPGIGLVAFLDHTSAGPFTTAGLQLTVGSDRALPPLHIDVRRHVTELLRARTAGARLALLTQALDARHPRLREDAALALPLLPGLEAAGPDDRDRVLQALARALLETDRAAASLILAVRRLRLAAAVEVLVTSYLAGSHAAMDTLLLRTITDLDADGAARQVQRSLPRTAAGQRRAVQLLARCSGASATACLRFLLRRQGPAGVRARAGAALLARGHAASEIEQAAGHAVLEDSRRLLARARPAYRSIRPRTGLGKRP